MPRVTSEVPGFWALPADRRDELEAAMRERAAATKRGERPKGLIKFKK